MEVLAREAKQLDGVAVAFAVTLLAVALLAVALPVGATASEFDEPLPAECPGAELIAAYVPEPSRPPEEGGSLELATPEAPENVLVDLSPHEDPALESLLPMTLGGRRVLGASTSGRAEDAQTFSARLVQLLHAEAMDFSMAWADDPTGSIPSPLAIQVRQVSGRDLIGPYVASYVGPMQHLHPVVSCRRETVNDWEVLYVVRDPELMWLPSEAIVPTTDAIVIVSEYDRAALETYVAEVVAHLARVEAAP